MNCNNLIIIIVIIHLLLSIKIHLELRKANIHNDHVFAYLHNIGHYAIYCAFGMIFVIIYYI